MPTTVPVYSPTPLVEPVSLSDLKAWVRVDGESEDRVLELCLKGARALCEEETQDFYAGGRRVKVKYELGEAYVLPSEGVPVQVEGFFKTLEALDAWNWEEYRKGISTNREYPLDGPYGAALQTYTVTVDLPDATADSCPEPVKLAILELAGEFFRNRETTTIGSTMFVLPVSYKVKLAPFRKGNVLF